MTGCRSGASTEFVLAPAPTVCALVPLPISVLLAVNSRLKHMTVTIDFPLAHGQVVGFPFLSFVFDELIA